MQISPLAFIFAILLALVGSLTTSVASPGGEIEVSIAVTANPLKGAPQTGCEASANVATARQQWWTDFARATPHPETGWQAHGGGILCGSGIYKRAAAEQPSLGAAYLIANVSTAAGFLPSSLAPERVLVLDITLSLQKLSGFGTQGKPVYQASQAKRKFFFIEGGDAFVPLLVATQAEREAFGMREVMLHATARRVEGSAAAYGAVSVTSDSVGSEVMLDGGVAGNISADTATVLRNVPAGLRLVGMRDASGGEIRQVVRVEANRTVLVALHHPAPTPNEGHFRLEPLGKNAQGYEEYRRGADAAVVVKIPAGEFRMGNPDTEGTPLEHPVYVSAFLMDKTGVTWGQYKQFVAATGLPLPPHAPYWGIHDDHPVVYVTWEEAKTYCEWAGGRLPTEAEREKAARGTDGRKYPWGNEKPEPQRGVYRRNWGHEATAPVGTHPAGISPYGLLDMGGNVWEWCSDWYDTGYYAVSPYRDPKGPPSGRARVARGGSWDSRPSVLSASSRNFGYRGYREGDFGFRCVMNVPR